MSFQAMTWALKQKLPTPHERWILVAIANYANENFEAWPSKAKIADDTGYSQSTICKYLASLEAAGIIAVVERFVDGGQVTSIIKLMACPPDGPPVRATDTPSPSRTKPLSVPRTPPVRRTDTEPITEPINEPKNAQAGACEAGASPACAERDADAPVEQPVEVDAWTPGRSCLVRPEGVTSAGYRKWLEAIGTVAAFDLEEKGAVGLIVSAPFPGKGSKLLGYVDAAGVAKFARAAP